jgi:hypothetical protein
VSDPKTTVMKLPAILLTCLLASGCAKEKNCGCVIPSHIYYLKAKVVQTNDIACGKPVLDFSEDSVRMRMITSLDNNIYSVINLPAGLIIQDKKLYVSVTTLKPEEEFACNTLGIIFPHVKITDAKNRD